MNSQLLQLLVLAAIAIFLIMRLRSVLGTRDGFEGSPAADRRKAQNRDFEVIEGGQDLEILDYAEEGSPQADALRAMKKAESDFGISDFLQGGKAAYEMIIMAYENGDLSEVQPFLSEDVYDAFASGIEARKAQGLTIEANFIGVRETTLADAKFDHATNTAELDVKFVGEMTSIVRDSSGDVVEGSETEMKRQKDVWTFQRAMGSDDLNWTLIATGG